MALPREIANLFDTSWLLEHRLTGGSEITTGGRRGYRLSVAFDQPRSGLFFPGNVVVDAELGILLRCISFAGSQPLMRYELRDVVSEPSDPGDFRPDIPAGMPVVEEPDEPPGPANPVSLVARQAVKEARSAARNLLGVIRGKDTRRSSGRTGGGACHGGQQGAGPVAVADLAGMEAVGGELAGPGRPEMRGDLGDRQVPGGRDLVDGPVDPRHVGHAGPAEEPPAARGHRQVEQDGLVGDGRDQRAQVGEQFGRFVNRMSLTPTPQVTRSA